MSQFMVLRYILASILSIGLSLHGYKRKSLNLSGSIAAFLVGFISFSASYRFGLILILFYYTSSKLTKIKEDIKAKLEDDYSIGGQRNWIQVLANSFLATLVALIYYITYGEDHRINFNNNYERFGSYLWCMYVAHYACAAADTWGSEIGILSTSKPRLITTVFIKEVPHGTNGGMSLLGTISGGLGGAFIGFLFVAFDYLFIELNKEKSIINISISSQYQMITLGLWSGIIGSAIDSLLGATLQATYYDFNKKLIVKDIDKIKKNSNIKLICGVDLLTNEAVNFFSIAITMLLSIYLSDLLWY